MDVGIRELKQRLSEYLDRVARGETIRVTDRGRPKAISSPVPDAQVVERGLAEGWLCAGEPTAPMPVRRARARFSSAVSTSRTVMRPRPTCLGLPLGSAVGTRQITIVSYDIRQAQIARRLGFVVLGV